MLQQHWGDLPVIPDTDSGIAAIEREQITKPRPVEVDGPKLFQPGTGRSSAITHSKVTDQILDIETVHSIHLIQYIKKVKSLQEAAVRYENSKGEKDNYQNLPLPDPIPDISVFEVKYKPPENASRDDKYHGKAPFCIPPEINRSLARKILKKSVAALCAHAGFDITTDSVLDFLTDVTHEYFSRMTLMLRRNVDQEALTGNTGFVDVMEQTFHDCGIGSIVVLQNYFNDRILGFHDQLFCDSLKLLDTYEKQRIPENKLYEEIKPVKPKDNQVPEIQFPIAEEMDDNNHDASQVPLQLEELQGALQNMESDATASLKDEESIKWPPGQTNRKDMPVQTLTQNLDTDEEIINVSDSPAPCSGDIDVSQNVPSVSVSDTMSPSANGNNSGKPPKKKKRKV